MRGQGVSHTVLHVVGNFLADYWVAGARIDGWPGGRDTNVWVVVQECLLWGRCTAQFMRMVGSEMADGGWWRPCGY